MRVLVGLFTTLVVTLAGLYAFSPRVPATLAPSVIPVDKMLLTGITHTSAGLITAGELGHILISADKGQSWQHAELDTQRHALITRLVFSEDGSLGLAIGHEGWILRTTDGGRRWQEVAFDEKAGEPLMDVARLPSGDWLAIGAFGQVMRSHDDGQSWQTEPALKGIDWHLNAIASSPKGRHWMIVGEAGTALRSLDGGNRWEVLPEFYDGSLYGISHMQGERWIAYGMRGNLFVSQDNGDHWENIQLKSRTSLHADLRLGPSTLVLGGQGGVVLATSDGGDTFELLQHAGNATLTDLYLDPVGDWWFTTDQGLRHQSDSEALALDRLNDAGASS